jgi:hypothetical protein
MVDAIDRLYPWQITDVHTSAQIGGGNCSISFVVRDINTLPAVPSNTYPNPFPHFNSMQATCTYRWDSTTIWDPPSISCDGGLDYQYFSIWFPYTPSNSDTSQLASNFTLQLSQLLSLNYGDTSYYKDFSADISFQSPGNLKGGCDTHSGMCTWSLKGSHTPTLITQDMIICQGDCDYRNWD